VIESQFYAGDVVMLATTFGHLAALFVRLHRYEPAATLYGAISDRTTDVAAVHQLTESAAKLEKALGPSLFRQRVALGAGMDRRQAALYALSEIELARTSR
jgi:hypothetical protein